MKNIFYLLLLLVPFEGCTLRKNSNDFDLYSIFTGLWILFLVFAVITGAYFIFGSDDNKRKNAGAVSIICIILFVALLITA